MSTKEEEEDGEEEDNNDEEEKEGKAEEEHTIPCNHEWTISRHCCLRLVLVHC